MYGGIENYSDGVSSPVPPDSQKNNPAINTGLEWATKYFKDDPLVNEPGSTYSYTTFGLNLAGTIATYAGGSKFLIYISFIFLL